MSSRRQFLGVAAAALSSVVTGCGHQWPAGLSSDGLDMSSRRTRRAVLSLGFSNYKTLERLGNATADAAVVGHSFGMNGYHVTMRSNLGYGATADVLRQFTRQHRNWPLGVFYLAGHAAEIDGRNYYFTSDAAPTDWRSAAREGMRLDHVLDLFEETFQTALFLIDTCRDNPWSSLVRTAERSPPTYRGIAPMVGGRRMTIISFSTAPRSRAEDGPPNGHGPYAQAIARQLTSGGSALAFIRRVNDDVVRSTDGRQIPWFNSNMGADEIALLD